VSQFTLPLAVPSYVLAERPFFYSVLEKQFSIIELSLITIVGNINISLFLLNEIVYKNKCRLILLLLDKKTGEGFNKCLQNEKSL
jgi:hypothetical protein